MNPDVFTNQLCSYLEDRFGIPTCPVPIRPGISGTMSWLSSVAKQFGKEGRLESLKKELEEEFDSLVSRYRKVLEGKRICILSATKDIDWIMEVTEKAGMIRERTVILERSDYSNDMELNNDYPDIVMIKSGDLMKEREIVERISPDVMISTMPITDRIPFMPIPLVHIPGPFTGIDYIKRLAVMISYNKEEGWRKDVL